MKLTREEFQRYIYSYNDDETFYKTLYLQEKEHPETFHEYCLTLDRKKIYEHRLYVPELQTEAWYPYMKETDLFHDINGNIVLSKHYRYTPVFPHEHEFFEILCLYDGTAHTTIQGIEHTLHTGDICIIHRIPLTVWGSLMTVLLLIFWYVAPPFSPHSSSH